MDTAEAEHPEHRTRGWGHSLLALILCLAGLLIGGGGLWLILLGGSWYYAVAGAALVATGVLLYQGRSLAFWLYAATFLFTLIWALWESGLHGWALMPRLLGPFIVLVAMLFALPSLRRLEERRGHRVKGAAIAAILIAGGALGVMSGAGPGIGSVWAQAPEAEAPTPAPSPDAPLLTPLGGSVATPRVMRETGEDWPAWGGTLSAQRYSPLTEITPENVSGLEPVWQYRTGDLPTEADSGYASETTPLKIGDSIYLCSAMGIAISLDVTTGREEWRFDPGVSRDAIPYNATCRGVAHFDTPDAETGAFCAARIIWGTLDARLLAVDAQTGQPCTDFGNNGVVSLENGIGDTVPGWYAVTSAPTIVRGVVVVGAQVTDGNAEDSPSGVVRGYDAVRGAFLWAWDLGRPGMYGVPNEGEVYTRGTPNMWTTASGDEALGLVYLPMGNSAVDYYGSNRSEEENIYSSALVALDVTTGAPVWHFQTVHGDVWDYDLGSQPTLIEFPTAQGGVPTVIIASKQGDIFVLDRRTGETLFPVEERAVPQGGVEPEYLSPTQPFSAYHTLAFPPLEEKDMWGMTPIDQLWCRIQFRRAHYEGIYTPPTTDRHWIQYPGYNGGNDWGGVAVDPARGILIANYNDMPNHNRLVPREEVERLGVTPINAPSRNEDAPEDIAPQAGAPYGIDVNAGWRVEFTGLMCKQPPYGGIRAIALDTGETLWDRPLGTARANGPFGIASFLPVDIGTPNNGGAAITAGGLVFIAAATDDLIRAIDIETGETLWSDVLPAGGQANPIIVEAGGRQMLIVSAGGHQFMETPIGDYIIAYALADD